MTTNDILNRADSLMLRATAADGSAVTLRLLAAHDVKYALENGLVPTDPVDAITKHPMATWCDDPKGAQMFLSALLKSRGLSREDEKEAAKAYRGNTARQEAMAAEWRNKTLRMERAFQTMCNVETLVRETGALPLLDVTKLSARVPMAWFIPEDAADKATHDALLGDASPWSVMLAPTGPNALTSIYYLTVRGAADATAAQTAHKAEMAAWEAAGSKRNAKPQAFDATSFLSFVQASNGKSGAHVGISNINAAAATWVGKRAQAKAREAALAKLALENEAKAAQAKALSVAQAAKDKAAAAPNDAAAEAIAKAAQEAAALAAAKAETATKDRLKAEAEAQSAADKKKAAAKAEAEAKAAKDAADKAAKGDDKRAGDTPNPLAGNALVAAATLLRNAISGDDYRAKIAPAIVEELRSLAQAVFRNEAIADLFMEERQRVVDMLEQAAKLNAAKAAKAG